MENVGHKIFIVIADLLFYIIEAILISNNVTAATIAKIC